MKDPSPICLHATCLKVDDKGLLIVGPSGSGKSALALQLISFGAHLVADDRTWVRREAGSLIASAPQSIAGMIEARGVGILRAPSAESAALALVIDLGREERARLPDPHTYEILGSHLPCLFSVRGYHFAAAILLYLREGLTSAP